MGSRLAPTVHASLFVAEIHGGRTAILVRVHDLTVWTLYGDVTDSNFPSSRPGRERGRPRRLRMEHIDFHREHVLVQPSTVQAKTIQDAQSLPETRARPLRVRSDGRTCTVFKPVPLSPSHDTHGSPRERPTEGPISVEHQGMERRGRPGTAIRHVVRSPARIRDRPVLHSVQRGRFERLRSSPSDPNSFGAHPLISPSSVQEGDPHSYMPPHLLPRNFP